VRQFVFGDVGVFGRFREVRAAAEDGVLGLHFGWHFGHLIGRVEGVRLHFAAVGYFSWADDYEAAVT
jgi:hypothetical protein